MIARRGSARFAAALAAAVVVAATAGWVATEDPLIALAPVALTLIGWALVAAPPHRIALAVFFLAIAVDNPKEHPAEGRWSSPLAPLGVALYENLNNISGVDCSGTREVWRLGHLVCQLRFSVVDVLLATLLVAGLLRTRARDVVPAPPALHGLLAAAWLAVVWMEVWGLGGGGDLKASLWQLRPLFWAPVIATIFATDLRGPRDHAALGRAIIAAATVKAALGAYYYFVVCRALGRWPEYATTHSDTVLFVAAAVVAMAFALERRTIGSALAAVAVLAVVLVGVIANGRRLAYISLVGSAAAVYLVLPQGVIRRTGRRLLAVGGPLAAVYLAVGWSSDAAIFGPARKVASLFSKTDRSAAMRDIENYNLVMSWKRHLLLGNGFGHEYSEVTRPEGIDRVFSLYRYIAHNSVLWLGNTGGWLGFTAFWMLLAALAYFAARGYRSARAPADRAAALVALSIVVIFGVQAYGDMGLNSWTAMFFLGVGLAVASKLAVASEAAA